MCIGNRLAFVMTLVMLAGSTQAQEVRIKKKPVSKIDDGKEVVYDKWWVSGALRDDTEATVLNSAYKTQAEAVAAAQRWLKSNHAVCKPRDWTYLKFVEIDADYSIKEKNEKDSAKENNEKDSAKENNEKNSVKEKRESESVGKGPIFDPSIEYGSPEDKLFTAAIDRAGDSIWKDVKNALKKRQNTVTESFRRAKAAKEFMEKDVKKLEQEQFRKVNGLVKEYNGLLRSYSGGGPGAPLFGRLQPMQPISDDFVRQAMEIERKKEEMASDQDLKKENAKDDRPAMIADSSYRETSRRKRFFSGRDGGTYVYEKLYVFLADGRYMQLNGDRHEDNYKNNDLNVSSGGLEEFAHWRWNKQLCLIEVYDIDYAADGRGSIVEKVKRREWSRWYKVTKDSIVDAYVENGREKLYEKPTSRPRLDEQLTKKALEVGRNAKWFYGPDNFVSPGR